VAFIFKEIDNAHVVWFEKSNQWVIFDEPQWFIFHLYQDQQKLLAAQQLFSKTYHTTQSEADQVVSNLYASIQKLLEPDFIKPDFTVHSEDVASFQPDLRKTIHYCFNNSCFTISYGSAALWHYIHTPLAHLEIKEYKGNPGIMIEVFPYKDNCAMRLPGYSEMNFTTDEAPQLKRLLYIKLASWFYKKDEVDWLTFIHASAVRKGDKVLLLCSASGSGKSTMAALLMGNGFELFSDDFVAADHSYVYPFPAALCLKNDSLEIISPEGFTLNTDPSSGWSFVAAESGEISPNPIVADKMVFIHYINGQQTILEHVNVLEALRLFHPESWVGDDRHRAEKFLEWFADMKFYKLTYSNNDQGIEVLKNLLDN
jgi:hypothetical protein